MNKCYCPFCGTINLLKNKRCMKCDCKLKPYDQDLAKLLYDQVEGDIRGGLVSSILAFLQAHTYGMILTITLIAVVVPNVILASQGNEHNVTSKPEVFVSTLSSRGYESLESLYLDFLSDLEQKNSLEKYRYDSYYEVDESKLGDRLTSFFESENSLLPNHPYYVKFISSAFDFSNPDEEYQLNPLDESIAKQIDDLKMLHVYLLDCEGNCEYSIEHGSAPFEMFYFQFVKRDYKWYFLKVGYESSGYEIDPSFQGYILNGDLHRLH